MFDLAVMFYVVVAVLLGAVGIAVWVLTREKRELPLPNETDYGLFAISLPSGIQEGHLTSARQSFEKEFETAISNCSDEEMSKKLQDLRKLTLDQYVFAFKGSGKFIILSNRNLIDEKLSNPIEGSDKRLLVSPESIIDCGEHAGFQIVFLKMPDPKMVGVNPPDRASLSKLGDALKYLKTAALNIEAVTEMKKERDFYKEEAELSHDETAQLRSKCARMERALSQKPLTSGEEAKVKGALKTRLEAFFYSGWRILACLFFGGLTYAIVQQTKPSYDPMIPTIIVVAIVFGIYPYLAKRF